jgi:DNA-binding GntR family transcriptional regulator
VPWDSEAVLDRSSPEPAYSQLARILREKIVSGEYRPGQRIPSVPQLTASFNVAPMTVRQAIDQLNREGVIVRERGRGTFVKPPQLGSAMFSLDDLGRYMTDESVEVRVLGAHSVLATPRVAARLQVEVGALVISIKRLLLRDDHPIFYHSEYLVRDPRRALVEAELGVTSLRGLFSGIGEASFKNGELTLHASALTESEATYLDEKVGTLAWVVEHLFNDFNDKPTSWGRFICRADCLTMKAHVGISNENPPTPRPGG